MPEFYVATRYEDGSVGVEDTGFFESAEEARGYMESMEHLDATEEMVIQVISTRKVFHQFTFEEA